LIFHLAIFQDFFGVSSESYHNDLLDYMSIHEYPRGVGQRVGPAAREV
jgi:hypothetical protein